ncbi:hypothetical protein ABZ016_12220 [Streptomyces sp. NPDC006372]|uniref:hypothetical protein n=1 Tax=Streptomyces sp. NPDC006372 TaxID=3155599 RepID=UPI00339E8415
MDQGLAGLLAGIAGLIGTGVGGLATAYGARLGAAKTLEAAHAQVEAQSGAEHEHWVREQRRQACSDILDAYGTFMLSFNRVTDSVWGHVQPADSDFEAVKDDARNFYLAGERLGLWGPDELVARFSPIRGAVEELQSLAFDSYDVVASADAAVISSHYDACRLKGDSAKAARAQFMTVARRALGSPL